MDESSRSLSDHTAYWLNRLSVSVLARFDQRLKEHSVTVAQWKVLIALHHGDASTTLGLAEFINVDSGAITRVVDRMLAKDLVKRNNRSKDRRSFTLELTPKGKGLIKKLIKIADYEDDEWLKPLTRQEVLALKKIFKKLLKHQGIDVPENWIAFGSVSNGDSQ